MLDELSRSGKGGNGNAFQRLMEYEISRKTPFESAPGPSPDRAIPVLRKKVSAAELAGGSSRVDAGCGEDRTPARAAGQKPRAAGISMLSPGFTEQDLCGERADIDLHDSMNRADIFYRVEGGFQGAVEQAYRRAIREEKPVLLEAGGEQVLFCHAGNQCCSSLREPTLAQLCRAQPQPGLAGITTLETEQARDYRAHHQPRGCYAGEADAFVWLTALLSSRGRLPAGTGLRQPVRLGQWSNLTRLTPTPHGLKIAALWSAGQASLVETPALLGVAQRHVFAFYSAALALGMIER